MKTDVRNVEQKKTLTELSNMGPEHMGPEHMVLTPLLKYPDPHPQKQL